MTDFDKYQVSCGTLKKESQDLKRAILSIVEKDFYISSSAVTTLREKRKGSALLNRKIIITSLKNGTLNTKERTLLEELKKIKMLMIFSKEGEILYSNMEKGENNLYLIHRECSVDELCGAVISASSKKEARKIFTIEKERHDYDHIVKDELPYKVKQIGISNSLEKGIILADIFEG